MLLFDRNSLFLKRCKVFIDTCYGDINFNLYHKSFLKNNDFDEDIHKKINQINNNSDIFNKSQYNTFLEINEMNYSPAISINFKNLHLLKIKLNLNNKKIDCNLNTNKLINKMSNTNDKVNFSINTFNVFEYNLEKKKFVFTKNICNILFKGKYNVNMNGSKFKDNYKNLIINYDFTVGMYIFYNN